MRLEVEGEDEGRVATSPHHTKPLTYVEEVRSSKHRKVSEDSLQDQASLEEERKERLGVTAKEEGSRRSRRQNLEAKRYFPGHTSC